jgi:hypothetical protein
VLLVETARALVAFRHDPSALVTASRRVVTRQSSYGPLWWLCSRLLIARDPLIEAQAVIEECEQDSTSNHLAYSLPQDATVTVIGWPGSLTRAFIQRGDVTVLAVDDHSEGAAFVRHLLASDVDAVEVEPMSLAGAVQSSDLVVIEARAASTDGLLAVRGSFAAAAVAESCGVPVWAAVGAGVMLPAQVWTALLDRWDGGREPWDMLEEVIPASMISSVVGPDGLGTIEERSESVNCPIASELFIRDIT